MTANGGKNGYFDSYLIDSGEAMHIGAETWVAIINLGMVEVEVLEEMDYPNE
jgi:hypothetical protein